MDPSVSSNTQSPSEEQEEQGKDRSAPVHLVRIMLLIVLLTEGGSLVLTSFVPSSVFTASILVALFVLIETVIALVLLVRCTNHALQRAYEAEEVSRLLQQLVERAQVEQVQKTQLEDSIQMIVHVLTLYANGNWNARVPLDHNNVLWQMSGALNNLLARLAHLRQENHALREAARGSHTD